jgi:hypothetical protein
VPDPQSAEALVGALLLLLLEVGWELVSDQDFRALLAALNFEASCDPGSRIARTVRETSSASGRTTRPPPPPRSKRHERPSCRTFVMAYGFRTSQRKIGLGVRGAHFLEALRVSNDGECLCRDRAGAHQGNPPRVFPRSLRFLQRFRIPLSAASPPPAAGNAYRGSRTSA